MNGIEKVDTAVDKLEIDYDVADKARVESRKEIFSESDGFWTRILARILVGNLVGLFVKIVVELAGIAVGMQVGTLV